MSNSFIILILLLLFSIFGATNSILLKYLFKEQSKNVYFNHNWFIVIIMFFAEMIGIPLYYIIYRITKKNDIKEDPIFKDIVLYSFEKKEEVTEELPKIKKIFFLGYPFIFDMFQTGVGLAFPTMLPGGINNMIKGVLLILITFLLSKFYLKHKYNLDQYISFIISIIGFILVGISTILQEKEKNGNESETNIGLMIADIILAIVCVCFRSLKFCIEEYYMRKYSFHPFLFIGTEGLFGFIFSIFLCIIFYFIKCGSDPSDFLQKLCTKDGNGIWRIENAIFAFQQIFDNKNILLYIIFLIISISVFNIVGISINKFGGAMSRSIVENTRAFFIWIFFVIPWVEEELRESFDLLRLIGLILIFGNLLIYFGILRLHERRRLKKQLRAYSQDEIKIDSEHGSFIILNDIINDN